MIHLGPLRTSYRLVLLAILLLAAALRFIGLDWDNGYYLHPDERFMVMVTVDTTWPDSIFQYFDSATSPLNPYNTRHSTFVYGTFPLFLTKAVSTFFGTDVYGEMHLAGRAVSALADTGTVFLAAWIARRFFGRSEGLLAGFLLACTVLHIQTAHYYTVDAISVFFATASFAAIVKGWDRRSFGWFAVAGLMIGLAGASKPNYLIALAFLALPVAEMIRRHGREGLIPWGSAGLSHFPVLPGVALSGLVAFWTFRIAQPYAFTGPSIWNISLDQRWLDDLSYWRHAQSGLIDIKSSIQWVDRPPVVYILDNLVRWGMGPPLGIAALAGLALLVVRLIGGRRWPSWWLLGMGAWSVLQLALYGTNMAQAQRYLLPIYPFLVVFAAGLLVELARRYRPARWANPGAILVAVTVAYTLFYAVAFDTLFVRPLSRVQASEWIYENVPAGSTLTAEYWDDPLPMHLPGEDPSQYEVITLDLYAYEGPESLKLSTLVGQIHQANYIILSSNRIIGSVPRQPERYPMATHYYEMLLSGELGFDLVADFSQTPELFGIALDDTNAEETLTVYEHPYVRIFKKTDRFNVASVYNELDAALGYGGVNYIPGDPLGDQMFLTPEEQAAYAEEGSWSEKFDRGSFTNAAPAFWWYIALQILALPALPLVWLIFRRFPDHGYAVAKVLGLLIVTWIAWLLSSLKLLPFGPIPIALGWFLLLAAGLILVRRRVAQMLLAFRARWRWLIATEVLFLTAFAGMAWIRSLNPGFWQPTGEDGTSFWYAVFNATVRSPYFPAYDPWLSGGQLHLSNWGQMPWVTVTRLTGIVPAAGYNLAFAGIFALLSVTLWTAASALIARVSPSRSRAGWIALLAPLLIALGPTLMLARRAGEGAWGYAPRPVNWFIPGGAGDIAYGIWQIITKRLPADPTLARDAMRIGVGIEGNNPFGLMISGNLDQVTSTLPIIALAIAMAGAIVLRDHVSGSDQWRLDRTDVATVLLGGAVAGAMLASSTWGFLPTLGLIIAVTGIRVVMAHCWEHPWPMARNAVLCAIAAAASGYIAFLPAIQEFHATQRNMVTAPAVDLGESLSIYGSIFFILVTWLLVLAAASARGLRAEGWAGRTVSLLALVIAAGALIVSMVLSSLVLFVLVALLLVMIAAWHLWARPAYLLVLVMTALAMVLMVLQNRIPMTADPFGRSSALHLGVFTWMLLGVAATVALSWIIRWLEASRKSLRSIPGVIWMSALAVVLAASAFYPLLVTRSLVEARDDAPRTLDATMLFSSDGQAPVLGDDRDAARWLLENVDGFPVILEATTSDHQLGGRISTMTGLPTVIGWSTPERIMRPGWTEVVDRRQAAVNEIFGTRGTFDSITPLLQQYDVQLIYVGPIERATYSSPSLQKFETAVEEGDLERLHQSGSVTIYYYPAWNP
jgi:YYY domain-containing protein